MCTVCQALWQTAAAASVVYPSAIQTLVDLWVLCNQDQKWDIFWSQFCFFHQGMGAMGQMSRLSVPCLEAAGNSLWTLDWLDSLLSYGSDLPFKGLIFSLSDSLWDFRPHSVLYILWKTLHFWSSFFSQEPVRLRYKLTFTQGGKPFSEEGEVSDFPDLALWSTV